jgi:hypothetical protein
MSQDFHGLPAEQSIDAAPNRPNVDHCRTSSLSDTSVTGSRFPREAIKQNGFGVKHVDWTTLLNSFILRFANDHHAFSTAYFPRWRRN